MKKLGFHVVLLGMIASGKDTQAKILKNKYALKSIESGIYLRKLLKTNTKDGRLIQSTVGKGKPAPVTFMKKFLIREISSKRNGRDLLFLGNPRLKPEAQLLKKILDNRGEKFIALYITLPDKETYRRSFLRLKSNMRSEYKLFDKKNLIKTRIAWHKDQVGKTVKYFQDLGILQKINGNQSVVGVAKDIEKTIKLYEQKYN